MTTTTAVGTPRSDSRTADGEQYPQCPHVEPRVITSADAIGPSSRKLTGSCSLNPHTIHPKSPNL